MQRQLTASIATAIVLALQLSGMPATAAETPTSFGERVDVEVVNVDVIVTDASGRRVTDLIREDFLLEVDGKLVPIDYFAPPGGSRTAASAVPQGVPLAPIPLLPLSAEASGAAAPVDLSAANLFVFVDQSALEWRTSQKILDELKTFVLPRTGGNERIMIAAFAQNLRILAPPTSDRAAIEAAFVELGKLRGQGSLVAAERNQLEREVRDSGRPRAQIEIETPGSVPGEEQAARVAAQDRTDTENLRAQIESFGEQQIDRQSRAVAALREWIGALAAIEGRKSVLFASAGFTSQPDAFLTQFLAQKRNNNPTDRVIAEALPTARLALLDDFERAVRAAQNARVAFYTISAREPPSNSFGAEFKGSGVGSLTPAPRDPAIAESASSLQRLSGATGGESLVLDDGLSDRLSTVTDDAAASYSLGFSTGIEAGAADHKIRVLTQDDTLTVRHRESFRRSSLAERAEAALVAAATFQTTVNPLAMKLELGAPAPFDKKGKEALVPILVRIPLALVTLVPEGADGRRTARLTARVAVLNEARHVKVGETAPIAISIPEADLEKALGSFWAYRAEVMVARGSQRVAVVVSDEIAGTVSTLTATIDRPVE